MMLSESGSTGVRSRRCSIKTSVPSLVSLLVRPLPPLSKVSGLFSCTFSLGTDYIPSIYPADHLQAYSIMQLSVSFSYLLVTLLFALARVEATPTKRSPGTMTLPLKRLPQPSDVHPSIVSSILDIPLEMNCDVDTTSPSFCNSASTVSTAVTRE